MYRSIELYDSESWILNKTDDITSEALETWCWRKMQTANEDKEVLNLVKEKIISLSNLRPRR